MALTDEDGLTFAVRVVTDAQLPLRSEGMSLKIRGKTPFDAGFEMARKIILGRLKDEQDRRFKRMLSK